MLISFLCVYSFKDWYKSLCVLIILMAVIEHPDMPKTVFNISGFNPWNILFSFVLLGWFFNKKREQLSWDMPMKFNVLLVIYFIIIVIGFLRMINDADGILIWAGFWGEDYYSTSTLLNEYLINSIKWVIPGLLVFHGCNSRQRLQMTVSAILIMNIILAVQVVRWMPMSALTNSEDLRYYGLKFLSNEVGYHRVNLSMMLSGAFWAVVSCLGIYAAGKKKIFVFSLPVLFMGLALTGGRMGYATWALVGGVISLIRWKRYIILAPIFVVLILTFVPAVHDRFTSGFDEETVDESASVEEHYGDDPISMQLYTITSGRSFAWPFVIDGIMEAPLLGSGREAMIRSGLSTELLNKFGEGFPHPHNASLMWIYDNGFIGFIPILIFYLLLIKYSLTLIKDKDNLLHIAIGGMTFSLVSALLIASIGSQSFYPREGSVAMWCAIGLMLRVYIQKMEKHNNSGSEQENYKNTVYSFER